MLTFEHFVDFFEGLVRLQAWYAWWLRNNTDMAVDEILETHVNFATNPTETWEQRKAWYVTQLVQQGQATDTAGLENKVLEEVRGCATEQFLRGRFDEEFGDIRKKFPFYGFKYEYHTPYETDIQEEYVILHFRNYYCPDSPFRHTDELAQGLLKIVVESQAKRPDVKGVQLASWVNARPELSALFPPVWNESAFVGSPGSHMGWWGQFMDRTGSFSARNGDCMRASGKFPCNHLLCMCPLAELKDHLEKRPTSR